MLEKIDLTDDIHFILSMLKENGQGYIVGGYIRDKLLGLEPIDCDFVTDISYDKLHSIFSNYCPKEIGKKFGVMQILLNGKSYEIAKMRQDIGMPEDRKEQNIKFTTDIYEDLKRRDFTINAIAYDGDKYFYHEISKIDLSNKVLRFIGNENDRIKEDPLRILRAFRFLGSKNLKIGFSLKNIKANLNLLDKISIERIREEFNKFVLEKNLIVFRLMSKIGVISKIIPEWEYTIGFDQQSKGHNLTVDEHIIKAMECVQEDLITRLALFFHDVGKPQSFSIDTNGKSHFYNHEIVSRDLSYKIMNRMKYDKKTIHRVCNLVYTHFFYRSQVNMYFVKKLLNTLGEEDIFRFYKIVEADKIAHKPPYDFTSIDKMKIFHYKIIKENIPYKKKDLNINGDDLKNIFNIQGKYIGEILDILYDFILNCPEQNKKEILLKEAHKILEHNS